MAGLLERVAAARPAPGWYSWRINEASPATKALTPSQVPERRGYSYGIPRGGLTEYNSGIGEATQTDRRSQLQQLYEAYLACPWSWACVNAIARTITAGGMVMDWDTDTGEGNQEAPDKPEPVLAVERLFKFCNPRQNIRQLMRNVVVDLEVFADAFIEVTWWGNTPVALYNLDNPTTTPIADEHGNVTGYVQVTEFGQRAEFEERDVIHISLDAPRSGVFGVSPTQAALLPITAWLFAAACGKEMARKGLPPSIHVDFPASVQPADQNRWAAQYQARNVGPRNIGTPVVTKGGAHIAELASGKIADVLAFLDQKRDEIIAGYGVPPSKVSIIESGNLGGGTGEEQTRTYEVDTCGPIGELILEAFNFAIVQNGFGVDDWQAKFRDVDYRASSVIEGIRDQRLRNGSWTLNKYRTEIGEPPVDGGDDPVLVDRQNLVLWSDMQAMSHAMVASKGAPAVAAGETPPGGEQMAGGGMPSLPSEAPEDGQQAPQEAIPAPAMARYRSRLAEALRALPEPVLETVPDSPADLVAAQLAVNFPKGATAWIKGAAWRGPMRVPVEKIDTTDREEWRASREPDEVSRLQKKLRKKIGEGKHPKPLILVQRPGHGKLLIADGHHRFLAAEAEGQEFVWAFTGKVDSDHGPWDTMAMSEDRGKAA